MIICWNIARFFLQFVKARDGVPRGIAGGGTHTGSLDGWGMDREGVICFRRPAYLGSGTGNYAAGGLNFDGLVNDDDLGLHLVNYRRRARELRSNWMDVPGMWR